MPAKYTVKIYLENKVYHAFNRSVGDEVIFRDKHDSNTFLSLFDRYLKKGEPLAAEVKIMSFCVMPTHYHLQLLQKTKEGMTKLIRAICTNYAMFFNKKYRRHGTIFQGIYKAILLDLPQDVLFNSFYIHQNPFEIIPKNDGDNLTFEVVNFLRNKGIEAYIDKLMSSEYYSSLPFYLGLKKPKPWLEVGILEKLLGELILPMRSYREYLLSQIYRVQPSLNSKRVAPSLPSL